MGCEGDGDCGTGCPGKHPEAVMQAIEEVFGKANFNISTITDEQREQFSAALQRRGVKPCIVCVGKVDKV